MAYYVPLGIRGVLFRVGTILIGILGGIVYFLAARRRRRSVVPPTMAFSLPD